MKIRSTYLGTVATTALLATIAHSQVPREAGGTGVALVEAYNVP